MGLIVAAVATVSEAAEAKPEDEQSLKEILEGFLEDIRADGEAADEDQHVTDAESSTNASPMAPARLQIRPGQQLNVVVSAAGEKEIEDLQKRVSDSGEVTLSLLGNVPVRGMTVAELQRDLGKRYEYFLRAPHVEVTYAFDSAEEGATSPWGHVTVLGRVKEPGRINIPPTQDLTLSMAIQEAGGFDTSAKQKSIRVTRQKQDGTTEKIRVDLRAVATKGSEDLTLQDRDVVFVPERLF